jgi:Spy/CpxP family protein refolding chaperone
MNTWRNLIGVGVLAVGLLGMSAVYGQAGPGRHHHGMGGGAGLSFKTLKALDLTNEQQTQIDAIRESHRETMKTLWSELRTIHTDITNKLLASGDVTAADFTEQSERAAQLGAQLFSERLAVGLEIRNVLTPEQLAKAAEVVAEKRTRRAERGKSAKDNQ